MKASRQHFTGQLQRPGQKPENVSFIAKERPDLTRSEKNAGIEWVDNRFDPGDVRRYGAVGDGVANDTNALLNAIKVFRGGNSIVLAGPLTAYEGGRIYFPIGRFVLDFSAFQINDILNLTFEGEGSSFEQNYFQPSTKLIFTGTSSAYGFRFVGNGTRNVTFRNLGIEYADNNFTGSLVELEEVVGFEFDNVSFGHQVDGSRYYTPAALLEFIGDTKFGKLNRVSFDEADIGVLSTSFGGNDPNSIAFSNVVFNDLQTAQCKMNNGEERALSFDCCHFDPVNLDLSGTPVVNGLLLGGSGWSVTACGFAGSTLTKVPSASFADLIGTGVFQGNRILTNDTGVILRGNIEFSANRIASSAPVVIEAGAVITGGSNFYDRLNSGTNAVDISPNSGSVIISIGPDTITAGFSGSYVVSTDNAATNGVIHYAAVKDASTNGPTLLSEHIRLDRINKEVFAKTTSYTVLKEETGCIFNNGNATGTVDFTLPTAVAGLEFTFYKITNQTVQISTASGDVFLNALAAGATDSVLENTDNELGAMVRVRSMNSAHWLVEHISGTWA